MELANSHYSALTNKYEQLVKQLVQVICASSFAKFRAIIERQTSGLLDQKYPEVLRGAGRSHSQFINGS